MSSLILPGGFKSQPQYPAELAPAYADAELFSLFNDGSGRGLARDNDFVPGVAPLPVMRQHGKALSFNGTSQYLASSRTVRPGAKFSVFVWVRPAELNTSYSRIIETSYASGFYLGSNTAARYCWIVNNSSLEGCVGGLQAVGRRDFVCGVFDGSNRILYVNGVKAGSSTATAPSTALTAFVSRPNSAEGWAGDIDTVAIFNRAFAPSEIWSLYQNPWQLLKAPVRRLWSAISSIKLTGTTSTQANLGSADTIHQGHMIAGAIPAQANFGSTTAIGQDHMLGGIAPTQVNTSGIAVIRQHHMLAGATNTQHNASSTGSIAYGLTLVTAAGDHANTADTGAITQLHALISAAVMQENASSATGITQAHILSVTNIAQAAMSSSGVIIIASSGYLVPAPLAQRNAPGTGAIVQAHLVVVASPGQGNRCSAGSISDGVVIERALVTGTTTATVRIKKPGIPAGTPEWLKTMVEILIGRRGNRIAVPKFRTLTFSANPTRMECEALYSYTNEVRRAVETIITRLDS